MRPSPDIVRSEGENLHRYGAVTITGRQIEQPKDLDLHDSHPFVMLQAGKLSPSPGFQAETVAFPNKFRQVVISSDLPPAQDGNLAVAVPLQRTGETPPHFTFRMQWEKGKTAPGTILAMDSDPNTELAILGETGARYIRNTDQATNQEHPFIGIRPDGSRQLIGNIPLGYGDSIAIRHQENESTRVIRVQFFHGTEGSRIDFRQQLVEAEGKVEPTLAALKADHEALTAFLDERDRTTQSLIPESPEKLAPSVEKRLEEAREHIIGHPAVARQIAQTLDAARLVAVPIGGGQATEQTRLNHLANTDTDTSDYSLLDWLYREIIDHSDESKHDIPRDLATPMVKRKNNGSAWLAEIAQHTEELDEIYEAIKAQLPEDVRPPERLTPSERILLALTLRLGLQYDTHYWKPGSIVQVAANEPLPPGIVNVG